MEGSGFSGDRNLFFFRAAADIKVLLHTFIIISFPQFVKRKFALFLAVLQKERKNASHMAPEGRKNALSVRSPTARTLFRFQT
jgi:hypothetical protein